MLFPEFRKKTRKSEITTFIQFSMGGSYQHNKGGGDPKSGRGSIKIGKEEIKLSVFADNIIVWVEICKRSYS